ncbi:MAG TPA: HAD family hydrolase [Gaiellales bacterium]|nr:HAD family hydrolase [Gaiellales bacterium]
MSRYDAVLLDAFGTLIDLDRPFERLQQSVSRHLGTEITAAAAERALRAEVTYYADHCREGSDADSLAVLRAQCATIVLAELGIDADPAIAATLLIDAIAFRAYDDVAPLLSGLSDAGVGVAVVSNWDCSLPDALASAGIDVAHVFSSGASGSSKPDPRIFQAALAAFGVAPERTLHVGDTEETDGVGARAAGIDVRIVDRGGRAGGADTITALTDVLDLL